MRTNTIRFSGLASGLDTESMVKAMLMPQQQKVDTTGQQQQLLELKKDKWKEINTKLLNFHKESLGVMKLEGTFLKRSISNSNPNIIDVDKNTAVPEGNHTIEIKEMATGATVSTNTIGKDQSTKLSDLGFVGGDKFKLTVNKGVTPIEIEIKDGMTIEDLQTAVDEKLGDKSTVNFKYDNKVGAFIISSKEAGKNQSIKLEVENAVMTPPQTKTGEQKLNALGIGEKDATGNFVGGSATKEYAGKNAEIIYNGGIHIESETNTGIEINGLKFNITGKTNEIVNISAKRDTEAIVNTAVKFVDEYNKLIEELNTLIDAPRNKSYMPLTSEQKKDMSEEDIKLWNEKIDKSILSGDQNIKDITTSMRRVLGDAVDYNGEAVVLKQLGITTGHWKENGKLYLDEEVLRKAIAEDPEKVGYVLNKVGETLYNDFNTKAKSSELKSINSFYNDKVLTEQITGKKERVSKLEEQMERMETMYYAKFTAMEKMMSQLNNQGNWLTSQLGGM